MVFIHYTHSRVLKLGITFVGLFSSTRKKISEHVFSMRQKQSNRFRDCILLFLPCLKKNPYNKLGENSSEFYDVRLKLY